MIDLKDLTKEKIEDILDGDGRKLLSLALNKEDLTRYQESKKMYEDLESKAISGAEEVIAKVKLALNEMEDLDSDDIDVFSDYLNDMAHDFASDRGMYFDGGEFWYRSTCY